MPDELKESLEVLPRGCVRVEQKPRKTGLLRLFKSQKEFSRDEWEGIWGERERDIRTIFETIQNDALGNKLTPKFNEALRLIDDKTGLSYKVLVASGAMDVKEGRVVVVTHNRLGFAGKTKDNFLAKGGRFGFGLELNGRKVEGSFIGIILNAEAFKEFKEKTSQELTNMQITDVFNALIYAHEDYLEAMREGNLQNFFSQQELDQALDWVLFGP